MAMRADLSFLTERGQPVAHARGLVTSVEETSYKESKRRVYVNYYRFAAAGRDFTGTSYSTGNSASAGESVDIEYNTADRSKSRISGMRRRPFSPTVAFLVIMPIAGIFVAAAAMRRGAMRASLLRDGFLATGKLESKQATSVRHNRRTVYLLTFSFTARDGRKHSVSARTADTARLEDESTEAVLYDAENPDRAFVVDELPSRPRVDEMGELQSRAGAAVASLILPAVVVAGNLLAALS
jgi:hypothetical protein